MVGMASDEEIYRKYADELTRFATGLVGPDNATDAVSAAMIGVFTSAKWPSALNQRAYLYRAVLNECRMQGRRTATRRRYEQRTPAAGDADPDGAGPADAPKPEVLAAVLALSDRQRAVVYLTYWEDLDPSRIAELLGISDGAVRRHLARARRHLRKTLR
jgi:RNA polymerase sigma-70 factor (ECF subfamily)